HLAGLVGDGGALAAAVAAAATWWNEPLRDRVNAVPGLARGLVLIAAIASAFDLVYLASSTLDGLVRLLLFLLLYRLAMRSAVRDLRDVAFLAFFMQAALTLRLHAARMVTGFSDRVQLGSFGEIETDRAVAMRVQIPEQAAVEPERLANLRWRGLALDTYDGHAWSAARGERSEVWRS